MKELLFPKFPEYKITHNPRYNFCFMVYQRKYLFWHEVKWYETIEEALKNVEIFKERDRQVGVIL